MSGERARGKNLKDSTPPRDAPGQLASSLGAFCARCVRIRGVPRAGAFRTRGDSRALRASTAPALCHGRPHGTRGLRGPAEKAEHACAAQEQRSEESMDTFYQKAGEEAAATDAANQNAAGGAAFASGAVHGGGAAQTAQGAAPGAGVEQPRMRTRKSPTENAKREREASEERRARRKAKRALETPEETAAREAKEAEKAAKKAAKKARRNQQDHRHAGGRADGATTAPTSLVVTEALAAGCGGGGAATVAAPSGGAGGFATAPGVGAGPPTAGGGDNGAAHVAAPGGGAEPPAADGGHDGAAEAAPGSSAGGVAGPPPAADGGHDGAAAEAALGSAAPGVGAGLPAAGGGDKGAAHVAAPGGGAGTAASGSGGNGAKGTTRMHRRAARGGASPHYVSVQVPVCMDPAEFRAFVVQELGGIIRAGNPVHTGTVEELGEARLAQFVAENPAFLAVTQLEAEKQAGQNFADARQYAKWLGRRIVDAHDLDMAELIREEAEDPTFAVAWCAPVPPTCDAPLSSTRPASPQEEERGRHTV